MPIRVISGTAKGRKLKMVPGDATRPVMDRVKEALFNILGVGVQQSAFLDLFAGTGSVGIEALSRGAARALFIDNDRQAIRTIHENLDVTRLAERAEVLRTNAFVYLQRTQPEAFEYVYVAPPQYEGLWREALLALDANPAHIQPDGIVVVQIAPTEREDVTLEVLQPYDERVYGNTLLWFFERPGDDAELDSAEALDNTDETNNSSD
ncbi:MAG: 16S rRNA (guanine(966)-N(2))-methyltransferase RsmD [Anaerolineae bacterium]|nr:16S rRNA (guanine(966)-N(2))-methyltransferase RsmD [Anaerolineae bacterium]